jgi:hypothetical protein
VGRDDAVELMQVAALTPDGPPQGGRLGEELNGALGR